jgi:hypothetical protein
VDLRKEALKIESGAVSHDVESHLVLSLRRKPSARVTVRGKVSGTADKAAMEKFQAVLMGHSIGKADVDSEGRFAFQEVPAGNYTVFANTDGVSPADRWSSRQVVVSDTDVGDLEVPAPAPKRQVRGRIVVEGDYPTPMLALTIWPRVDAGPPFTHPFTLRSMSGYGLVVEGDGRFTLDLPEGRHKVRVDGFPESAYRLKSARHGSVDLSRELLNVSADKSDELVLTFSAASPVRWPRVKGRVLGADTAREPVRVVLVSTRTKYRIEATPKRNGSFEFPKVPPDTYMVLTAPRVAAMAPQAVVVADRDVSSVNVVIPARRDVLVRVISTDGTTVPSAPSLLLTRSETEAYSIRLDLPFIFRTARELVCIVDVCSTSFEAMEGEPMLVAHSKTDGRFVLRIADGDYQVAVDRIPAGFQLDAIRHGAVDLRQQPLHLAPNMPNEIVVVLKRG